jgi:hypothetical protein
MPAQSSELQAEPDIEADVDTVIAACGGEREAIRALITAYEFLIDELERLRASVSVGHTRRH